MFHRETLWDGQSLLNPHQTAENPSTGSEKMILKALREEANWRSRAAGMARRAGRCHAC